MFAYLLKCILRTLSVEWVMLRFGGSEDKRHAELCLEVGGRGGILIRLVNKQLVMQTWHDIQQKEREELYVFPTGPIEENENVDLKFPGFPYRG